MKEIVVISGKGGTGKTSLVAAFAALAERPVLADCDVDAADLHLVLTPEIRSRTEFRAGHGAFVRQQDCIGCGVCQTRCRFDAVMSTENSDGRAMFAIDGIACEGCGVCVWFCPANAIAFPEQVCGEWFVSDTRFGPMVHAKLGIAQENSGKLVTLVRKHAREIGEANGHSYIIVDGSPGIGCPVIASISGADLVVVVTEPTVSGEHDLERVAELTEHFGIPTVVCINKHDINPEATARITERAKARGLASVGHVRYDKAVTKAQTVKATVTEYTGGAVTQDIKAVWRHVVYALG